jgi:hypothetical protein
MHQRLRDQHVWLSSVLRGHYAKPLPDAAEEHGVRSQIQAGLDVLLKRMKGR